MSKYLTGLDFMNLLAEVISIPKHTRAIYIEAEINDAVVMKIETVETDDTAEGICHVLSKYKLIKEETDVEDDSQTE